MDLMTIFGFLLGGGAVYYTVVEGDILSIIFNRVAFILVFGGTFGSTLITYPWKIVRDIPKSLMLLFIPPKKDRYAEEIERIMELANIASSMSIDELGTQIERIKDPFLKSGINMLLEDVDESEIYDMLEREIASTSQRHQRVITAWKSMGAYSPVFGLLGTLIGIVQILRDIADPATMGANMAIAITTTFYGIFGANFIFLPAAGKLEVYSSDEITLKELQLLGIISIKQKQIPIIIKRKLDKFLSKKMRNEE